MGVADPHESPAAGAAREGARGAGVEITVEDLLVVSWLSPWQGWMTPAFLFRATAPSDVVEAAMLEHREIAALHWCASEDLDEHVADYTARLVRAALRATEPLYLEDARPAEQACDGELSPGRMMLRNHETAVMTTAPITADQKNRDQNARPRLAGDIRRRHEHQGVDDE